jgi:uncharacterized membrane protein
MTTMQKRAPSTWRGPLWTLGLSLAGTFVLLALSTFVDRPADWQPPPGADIALGIHLATIVPAIPLGGYVLWGRKGGLRHRLLGRIWAGMMMVSAISTFWLQSLDGGFSFIHLLSILTLVSIPVAIFNARRGNIRAHRNGMRGVYFGLIAAGLMAVLPGRLLNQLLLG